MVLYIAIMIGFLLQAMALFNTVANLLHALFKVPNTLVIKQVYMISGRLKATKLQPELAKVHA